MERRLRRVVPWFLLCCGGCGGSASATTLPAESAQTAAKAEPVESGLLNEREPMEGVITGGQPDQPTLARLKAMGVTVVVSLRAPSEPSQAEERAWVEGLGMRFVSIPIAGAEDLTADNARALDEAITGADGKVLVHCGTGNRAGALLALRALHVQQMEPAQALELGERAGLTKLRGAVEAHFVEQGVGVE